MFFILFCIYHLNASGFAGDSLLDQCQVDMIGDSVEDFMVKPSVQIRREKDAEKKAGNTTYPSLLTLFTQ